MQQQDRGAPLAETVAFFAERAAGWDERFPDDAPAYERAVCELLAGTERRILDAGCGTGRALPLLHARANEPPLVVGLDATPEMLTEAGAKRTGAALLRADGLRLPFATASFDAVFAAGFLPHLSDAEAGLVELARVVAEGGRLALFHAIGRRALAARHRHGDEPAIDDIRAEAQLAPALARTGWSLASIDDGDDRYLAIAVRS